MSSDASHTRFLGLGRPQLQQDTDELNRGVVEFDKVYRAIVADKLHHRSQSHPIIKGGHTYLLLWEKHRVTWAAIWSFQCHRIPFAGLDRYWTFKRIGP